MKTCGAKTRAGTPCQRSPVAGRTRCRLHGGATPLAGPGHPTFIHGRFSKALPARMRERFEEAFGDQDLGSMRGEIAVLISREEELLEKLDQGESGEIWRALGAKWQDLVSAQAAGDQAAAALALNEVGRLIQRGAADWQVWREFRSTAEDRRKLTESHEKIQRERDYIWPAEAVAIMVETFADILRRYIDDRDRRSAAAGEMEVFLRGRSRSLPSPRDG